MSRRAEQQTEAAPAADLSAPKAAAAGALDRIGLKRELVPSWEALREQLGAAAGLDEGARAAAEELLAQDVLDVAYALMDEESVVDSFTAAYDGGLEDCVVLVDSHVRLLVQALLSGA